MTFQEVLARDGKLVYKNKGDSLLPLVREGRDLVVIEPYAAAPRKYDVAFYQRDNGAYVLHRIVGIRKDGYVLCGDNQWKREFGVREEQLLGRMTAVIRDGQEIPLEGFRYRLYVHARCDVFPVRAAVIRVRNHVRKKIRRKRKTGKGGGT